MYRSRALNEIFLFAGMLLLLHSLEAIPQNVSTTPYTWKNVQIGGGGFVTGIVFHPTSPGLCYCRTDIGGAYRRDPASLRWEPLLDWISYDDRNLLGVESIALDPSDPNWVFLSCGTYSNPRMPDGAILWSSDRGKSFQRTNVPFKMGGNEDGRGNGERMAVDPHDGNILYLGTRFAGLWKSEDRAKNWKKVESFPDVTENPPTGMADRDSIMRWRRMNQGSGIIFVLFDPSAASNRHATPLIYAGISLLGRSNLFRSRDAGLTWEPIPGEPTQYRPTHAALSADGMLYITYGNNPGPSRMTDGAVWKFDPKSGIFTDITPDKPGPDKRLFGYAAVSVDAQHPSTLIVSTYFRYGIGSGEEIFRSTDAGKSWNPVFGSGAKMDPSLAPYTMHTGIHWLFDIEIDPANPDHALFTTGYGGHETFNLTDMDKGKQVKWSVMNTGIEETVALDLLSPSKGAPLLSAIGDYGGFVHWDLDHSPAGGNYVNPRFGNTSGLACASLDPDVILRAGAAANNSKDHNIGYSLDGGKTWQPTDTVPSADCRLGSVAVSADGKTWTWSPESLRSGFGPSRMARTLPVYYTADHGSSWHECQGIPGNTRVIADPVNPSRFYGLDLFGGILYSSLDSGSHFSAEKLELQGGLPDRNGNRGDSRGGQDRIYATPGKEGDLWIAAYDGLYHQWGKAAPFMKLDGVNEIQAFGFGKGPAGSKNSSLYLAGKVNAIRGLFRSDDLGESWIRINDDQHQWGLILQVTGDPKQYGRVYAGTHGLGIIYGDPGGK